MRDKTMEKRFKKVAVGGTFDEFHKGHRMLLMKAFEVGKKVLIGVSSDRFAEKLGKPHMIAGYEERVEMLKSFLRTRGLLGRAEIVPLDDPYGVTLSGGCIEALVVSRETEPRAYEINEIRETKGIPHLQI
ncbi:MAG: pantetheine-phosphate adenylyltransferase, partial [Thermoproteota archaeon]|nr:pantetheine-phosphate adenylyltransferase [Thermoproteota archaeon]